MKQTPPLEWAKTTDPMGRGAAETIACPCCGSTSLSVRDVEYGPAHEKGIQRYISCFWCGAFNGVNLKRAGGLEKPVLQAVEEIGTCISAQQKRGWPMVKSVVTAGVAAVRRSREGRRAQSGMSKQK
jgi:hypothetical protein